MARKKEIYDDSWMYILLLTTVVILAFSLKTYEFTFLNTKLSYSLVILPFFYLITNYITKKYGYAKTVVAISASGLGLILFFLLINFALGKTIFLGDIGGEFCAYVTSQLVNLTIYNFLLKNTKMPLFLVFLTYLFAPIVFYMFYTLINLATTVTLSYWKGYFLTLAIQAVICLILSIVDKKIAYGIDNE